MSGTVPNAIPTLGRYQLAGEIGRGAMGIVYKAFDPLLDRMIAIKTVNLAEAGQEEAAEYEARFIQEAKAAGGLSHPHIVTVYDFGRDGGVAFLAMELLAGRELKSLIGEGRRVPIAHAIEIAAQVADGLDYAHDRGVVHRDIKPANIMILDGGRVKITDFGIARRCGADARTQVGVLLGSPKYMAPEQILGERADGRSDLFSLGVVLYETLTGCAPFAAESVTALMHGIVNTDPAPPSIRDSAIAPALDAIVAKALAKDPAQRYQHGRELAADLRGILESATEEAPPLPATGNHDQTIFIVSETQRTPREDLGATLRRSALRGLSRSFDSVDALHRLAAMTGSEAGCLGGIEKTVALGRTPTSAASPSPHDAVDQVVKDRWSATEKLILGASVTVATLVAGLIAFT